MFTKMTMRWVLTFACLLSPRLSFSGTVSNIAAVNGVKISYEVQGEGPALVLLNDGILDKRMWDDQVKEFSAHYRVIRYDFRGWGKSELPKEPFSHVDDLHQLLQFLRIEKVLLLGVLVGGGVALDFALEHPEMVDCVIVMTPLVSGFHYSTPTKFWAETWQAVARSGDVSRLIQLYMSDQTLGQRLRDIPPLRKRVETMLSENFPVYSVDFGSLLLGLEPPTMQLIPAIHTPTLILTGDAVNLDLQRIMEYLQRGIHDARRIAIPHAGCLANIERPAEFNRIVLDWLSKRPVEGDRPMLGI